MTIGQLAAAAGVNVETIRYYQRRGLLSTPARPAGGQRRYSSQALERLVFIRDAQKLAFTLGDVARLLAMSDAESCKAVRDIAAEKLLYLAERIGEIDRVRKRLRTLIKRCEGNANAAAWPIIRALVADERPARARRDAKDD